jgi:hypothetical protein
LVKWLQEEWQKKDTDVQANDQGNADTEVKWKYKGQIQLWYIGSINKSDNSVYSTIDYLNDFKYGMIQSIKSFNIYWTIQYIETFNRLNYSICIKWFNILNHSIYIEWFNKLNDSIYWIIHYKLHDSIYWNIQIFETFSVLNDFNIYW